MKQIQVINQTNNDEFTFYDNLNDTILREFDGFEYADVKSAIENVAGRPGASYVTSSFGRRRFSFQGDLVASDVFAQRRAMLLPMAQDGTMKLFKFTTYDNLELQVEAEIVRLINPYNHKVQTFIIEAIAPDWRFFGQTLKTFETGQTVIGGGGVVPGAMPWSLKSEGIISNVVDNLGNEETDPFFTIDGPGTQFTVGNQTTGEEFIINYSLVTGQFIEVDVKNRTVKLNGTTNIYSSFTGDFWRLQPGENTIRFLATGLDVTTLLTIAYRDAYRGV